MNRARISTNMLALTCLTVIAGLTTGGTAVAEEPSPTATDTTVVETVPPPGPEETDLIEGAPTGEAAAPTTSPEPDPIAGDDEIDVPTSKPSDTLDARPCEPGYQYTPTSKTKDYHKGVGAEQANYNGTSRTARSTFISEVTGKVGIAYTGELKVGASVVVAEIEGKFGVNVSVELTARLGNTIAVNTPSKRTTHARYGVYRLKSYGYNQYRYTNCTKGVKKNVTIYTPRRVGWVLWETK
ncbi:hypothetical protein [Streptomyces sp. E2N166]|uniref:hypothetical protein n=1 Tax=Streptomyces sp. E2N166 TaxID=1851909 RepID=UPI001290F7C2|nr:hypothetical protein [Streptomyces sp. E2N166]